MARRTVCVTIDDPTIADPLDWRDVNSRLLSALRRRGLQAVLFVCGRRVRGPAGAQLVGEWDDEGHLIANHSYSHWMYGREAGYERFAADFRRNLPVVRGYRHYARLFRYPFLKEGDTAEARDRFRRLLHEHGYGVGHVTINGSDWFFDSRWRERRRADATAPVRPYRECLVEHLLARGGYYDDLMTTVGGGGVPHTLLLHFGELTALSLDCVLERFEQAGWQWVDANVAFANPMYRRAPQTLPAGESLVWALAAETGVLDDRLRWPTEGAEYERPILDARGL